jgi:peptidylprolyl isomerase
MRRYWMGGIAVLLMIATGCESKLVNATGRDPVDIDEDRYTVTSSGLRYFDLTPGTGATPVAGQTAVVHYTGWLKDSGLEFESTRDRNIPLRFTIGADQVVAGWEEGISTMQVGGLRQLVIPPSLGYGDQVVGPIPPNTTLIFEVELVALE